MSATCQLIRSDRRRGPGGAREEEREAYVEQYVSVSPRWSDDLRRIFNELCAEEIALMLLAEPAWRLPGDCWRARARMAEGHERMQRMIADEWADRRDVAGEVFVHEAEQRS